MRQSGGYGDYVCLVDILGFDEPESMLACGLWRGFLGGIKFGFPDHVADAIADLENYFDDVGGEGCGVKGQRANFGYMSA